MMFYKYVCYRVDIVTDCYPHHCVEQRLANCDSWAKFGLSDLYNLQAKNVFNIFSGL
jgi:hypothetical protein